MLKSVFFATCLTLWLLFAPCASPAGENLKEGRVPAAVEADLQYLFAQIAQPAPEGFDVAHIRDLLAFVSAVKAPDTLYRTGDSFDLTSAYYEFGLRAGLSQVLRFVYNPDFPTSALAPSSIRLCYWTQVDGSPQAALPRLWEALPNLDRTRIIRGVEHEAITPDLFSGAYYDYDLDRLLILCRFEGRSVLLSLSKQRDVSDVGRKGLILGPDENWDYFYTGEEGLAKPGLGWVDSYIYDSYSLCVYQETAPGSGQVKIGVFKWLRAGWSRINMVQSEHIYRGLERYARGLKAVMDSPLLPPPDKLADIYSRIRKFSAGELREKISRYFNSLESRLSSQEAHRFEEVAELLADDAYWKKMNRRQMQAAIFLEYVKYTLGKNHFRDVAYLLQHRTAIR